MASDVSYSKPTNNWLLTRTHLQINARTWTLLAFVVLVLLAGSMRLLTFDRYSPYLDYADENNMYLMGRDWRGVEDIPVVPEWLAGYPPLYVWMNIVVQQVIEATWTGPWLLISDYFYALRLIAALSGIVTTLLVASIAWQVGGSAAGWLAGFVWGLSPIIVEHNNLAIPDPMVFLACALSITTAIRAWTKESPRWLLGSLCAAIAAIYLKYPAIYILIPCGIVTLDLTRRHPRRMLPWLAVMLVVSAASALYLIFGYGSFRLDNREADTVRNLFLEYLLSPNRNLNNAYFALYPLGVGVFAATLVGGAAAYWYARRHKLRLVNLRYVGLLLAFAIAGVMITSTYSNVWLGAGKIRHVLPVTLALLGVWGAALGQIIWAVQAIVEKGGRFAGRESLVATGVVAVMAGIGIVPAFAVGDIDLINRFRKTSVQEVLWRWTDVNIPTDGLILAHPMSLVAHTWNRHWSGYDGVKSFEWWLEDESQITDSNPERYIERGITYFVMDGADQAEYFSTPALAEFVSHLTLIKTIPAAPNLFGSTVYFYRMQPPEQAADADFGGEIRLVGYDLSGERLAPGESLHFRPYWRTDERPTTNYSMFLHIYPSDEDRLIAQYDGAPSVPARPTLTWDDTGELYLGSDIVLTLPADTPAGEYRLAVGLYDFNSGARLSLADGETYFTIPLRVE